MTAASEALAAAEAALARCREGCGGLVQAVADSRTQLAIATGRHDRAVQADQIMQQAWKDFGEIAGAAEATVTERSKQALEACATHLKKLKYAKEHRWSAADLLLAGVDIAGVLARMAVPAGLDNVTVGNRHPTLESINQDLHEAQVEDASDVLEINKERSRTRTKTTRSDEQPASNFCAATMPSWAARSDLISWAPHCPARTGRSRRVLGACRRATRRSACGGP